jgi:hypothetical protein
MTHYHKHHIIPRHAGGTDDPSNLVYLTVEEHAEAHRKLYEKYGRKQDLWAWKGLSGQWTKLEIWGHARQGVPHTEESKQKMRNAMTGRKLTEEHKAKINPTGRKQPQSQKNKVAKALSKQWQITDPEGNVFIIENLQKFARDNELDQGNLARGGNGTHKKYKAKRL